MTVNANVTKIRDQSGNEELDLAIILGSGLGAFADALTERTTIPYMELEGFPPSGVSGHAGNLTVGRLGACRAAVLSGRIHYYESGNAAAMMIPLQCVAELGCRAVLLTNSAGSTRENVPPGSLMIIKDHLNWSGLSPLIGTHGDGRFVDMTEAYDRKLVGQLQDAGKASGVDTVEGIYAWFSGPSFETPAEINAVRMLGADAVGMSTVPEVILARYLGLRVAAISLITNYAAGMTASALTHEETKDQAAKAARSVQSLLAAFADSFEQAKQVS